MTLQAQAEAFVADMHRDIPQAEFMRLSVQHWDGQELALRAPLHPNTNDKGTAFAGALASTATVTGWALLMLWAREHIGSCHVAVYHSELRYRHPVEADFVAVATLPGELAIAQLRERIASRGRGRVDVQVVVHSAGQEAVTLTAGYAVWPVTSAAGPV